MDHPAMRASDDERDETVELLRAHMLAGRLSSEEFDDRVGEACRAKTFADLDRAMRELPPRREPAPVPAAPVFVKPARTDGGATTALVLAISALVLFVITFGFASVLTLPLASAACLLGRDSGGRAGGGSGTARAGYLLGLVGIGLSCLWFGGCAVLVS